MTAAHSCQQRDLRVTEGSVAARKIFVFQAQFESRQELNLGDQLAAVAPAFAPGPRRVVPLRRPGDCQKTSVPSAKSGDRGRQPQFADLERLECP